MKTLLLRSMVMKGRRNGNNSDSGRTKDGLEIHTGRIPSLAHPASKITNSCVSNRYLLNILDVLGTVQSFGNILVEQNRVPDIKKLEF